MVASPYYVPDYFAPGFFDASFTPAPEPVAGVVTPYDAPTYFAPSFFYSGPSASVPIVPTVPIGRDQAAYTALLSLLSGTGAFEDVLLGDATQRSQAGSDNYPLAVVTPQGWEESDDYDPTLILRRTSFAITLVVKSPDPGTQFNELDQLSAIVQGVVDRSNLGGTCLPPLTKIKSGNYDKTTHFPEQSVELDGEFASLFDPLAPLPASSTSS